VPTVLVVDDSSIDRRVAGALVEKSFPCTVCYAADGEDALRQMAQQAPDLVLTDLQMPGMNGLDLMAAIKNDYPLVPVILMTARGSEDIAAQALRQGAASYVPKKRLPEDLLPTIQRILHGLVEDQEHPTLMHYLEKSEAVFVLHNDWALIKTLVRHLQQVLRCLALADETERLRVGLAVEEALANAYYHGNLEIGAGLNKTDRQVRETLARERTRNAPYRDRHIRVTAKVSREAAVFVVADEGPGFDVARLPKAVTLPDPESGAGRGIILMRIIMDEVRFNPSGNEVTLIKRRLPEADDS
jgi:CheY-like chemotaxis protein/anti-sigma regulatory factor (Ser/Thr protein kinase)